MLCMSLPFYGYSLPLTWGILAIDRDSLTSDWESLAINWEKLLENVWSGLHAETQRFDALTEKKRTQIGLMKTDIRYAHE